MGAASGESFEDVLDDVTDAKEARRRRTPEQKNLDLEELRQKLVNERSAAKGAINAKLSVSFSEKLMFLILVLFCLYVGSPFFRTSVKSVAASVLFGSDGE